MEQGRFIECKICNHKFRHSNDDERNLWQQNKYVCPNCGQTYCNKPKTEIKLFCLQDKFFESNKDEKYLNDIYRLLMLYSKSLFLKTFRKIVLHPDDLQYYLENAVSIFIEEFYYAKEKPILISFGGMLILKLKQALYSKAEKPLKEDSIYFEYRDGNCDQFEDKINYFSSIENEYDSELLVNNLYDLIIQIENYSSTPFENYMRELALNIHLLKGEKYADKLYNVYARIGVHDKVGKIIYMYTLDILKNRLNNKCLKNN